MSIWIATDLSWQLDPGYPISISNVQEGAQGLQYALSKPSLYTVSCISTPSNLYDFPTPSILLLMFSKPKHLDGILPRPDPRHSQ